MVGSATDATGNAHGNTIIGNDLDNRLKGGGGIDSLIGGDNANNDEDGHDTFIFEAGESDLDSVHFFQGNGAAAGDQLLFVGYGAGATFVQLTSTEWQVSSFDGSIQESILVTGGTQFDASDVSFIL